MFCCALAGYDSDAVGLKGVVTVAVPPTWTRYADRFIQDRTWPGSDCAMSAQSNTNVFNVKY